MTRSQSILEVFLDSGDRVTSEFHFAGYPPVGRENGAFRRYGVIGGH